MEWEDWLLLAEGHRMAPGDNDIAPPKSLTAYVVERLKDDVASGVIPRGELIKQTVLAKRYGVSATPVREAMRLLESDGVITYSAHRGASVREMTPASVDDLYRLRAAAESVAAQMAVERMTNSGLEKIRAKHQAIAVALRNGDVNASAFSLMNRDFHFAIYALSSQLVVEHVGFLWSRFTPDSTIWRNPEHAASLQHGHDQILDAVVRRDAPAAGALTAAHIEHAARTRATERSTTASGDDDPVISLP